MIDAQPVDADCRAAVERYKAATRRNPSYDRIDGVICPFCGRTLPPNGCGVRRTRQWEGGLRERYHTCPLCEWGFKSVES